MPGDVHDLPPLVRCDPHVLVEVLSEGDWYPGVATAYRGRRVQVQWTRAPGMQHSEWVPAERVRRVEPT